MTLTYKLNQFIDNLNGQFIEVSYREAVYQCMDLAYAWVFCLDYPKATIQHQYAYEVFTKPNELTYKYFDLIPNTDDFIPQDGDICVFKGGTAGHIAICLGGGTRFKFKRFEQNNPLGTSASINERGYTNMLGVLRPKVFSLNESLMYKGYDLSNPDSMKIAVDKLVDIMEGKYITSEEHQRIINELDSKSTEQATLYAKKEEEYKTKISALDEALLSLQTTEHSWETEADKYQRLFKVTQIFLSDNDIQITSESTEDEIKGALSTATRSEEIANLYATLSSRLILSNSTPEAVLEALQKLEDGYKNQIENITKQLSAKIEALRNKQPTMWQFIINKYFK